MQEGSCVAVDRQRNSRDIGLAPIEARTNCIRRKAIFYDNVQLETVDQGTPAHLPACLPCPRINASFTITSTIEHALIQSVYVGQVR